MTNVSTSSSANVSRRTRYPGSINVVSAPVPPSSTRTSSGTITIGWCATTATATISPMGGTPFERVALGGDVLHVAEEIEAPGAALAADPRPSGASERRLEVAHEEAIDP